MKIGVFICHCGSNIAGTVDLSLIHICVICALEQYSHLT